jgi:hypothetical protein
MVCPMRLDDLVFTQGRGERGGAGSLAIGSFSAHLLHGRHGFNGPWRAVRRHSLSTALA